MTDGLTSAVRGLTGLGRLLPLGGPRDGAWIAEDAARGVLRAAVRGLPGARLDTLRVGPADPEGGYESVVPPPPGALPSGPLRVTADFAATAAEPLPDTAARVRDVLAAAAAERLGLVVAEVDLRVTDLLADVAAEGGDTENGWRGPADGGAAREAESVRPSAGPAPGGEEARAAEAALAVPGVSGLTGVLGRAVRLTEGGEAPAALPHRHAHVEIAVHADRRALDVAREVRAAVSQALPDRPTVAVLITAVG
ncbi:nucleopolyhedrovirus P10 family protein [Streptomyces sp. NPDC002588]|uniref:nucleopolyhedrovirus P10 family protein n=1 Tax=Streptomyces sp. NPDC002588 TaxID=3154419 RepID=UPI0033225EA1